MARRNWTREQDMAILHAKLTHGTAFRGHPDLPKLAEAMNRSTDSLIMRKANFDALDPAVSSSGLSNAAALTKGIWAEYQRDRVGIADEARQAYQKILGAGSR